MKHLQSGLGVGSGSSVGVVDVDGVSVDFVVGSFFSMGWGEGVGVGCSAGLAVCSVLSFGVVDGSGVGAACESFGVECAGACGVSDCSGLWDEAMKGIAEPKLLEIINTHAIMPTKSAAGEYFISYRLMSFQNSF